MRKIDLAFPFVIFIILIKFHFFVSSKFSCCTLTELIRFTDRNDPDYDNHHFSFETRKR